MWLVWVPVLYVVPGVSLALDFDSMRTIAGLQLLDAKVEQVLQIYGVPAALCASGKGSCVSQLTSQLPGGDWKLAYKFAASAASADQRTVRCFSVRSFQSMTVYAKGGVGETVVKENPRRLVYEISSDPYVAHKVSSVVLTLRNPLSVSQFTSEFGQPDIRTTEADGSRSLRYWVLQKEDEMPFRLYAVDSNLDSSGKRVVSLTGYGPLVDFVADELRARFNVWERNLYD